MIFFCAVAHEFGARELGARDFGARDFGARDFGARDFGARDFGARDFGARDFGAHEFGARDFGTSWLTFPAAVCAVTSAPPSRLSCQNNFAVQGTKTRGKSIRSQSA